MISLENVCAKYGKNPVLKNISFDSIEPGQLTAVIGPNGTGKSTLFKCIAGIHSVESGRIYKDGKDITHMSSKQLVKEICYMPQNTYSDASLTVFEVTLMAKKFAAGGGTSKDDIVEVSQVLQALQIEDLASRYIPDLSGGQRQLVTLAQALIRKPSVLLLDEPTAALDLNHQIESLDLVRYVVKETGMVCFVSLHDLSLAGRYADVIMILEEGALSHLGTPSAVLKEATVREVYSVNADVHKNQHGKYVLPYESLTSNKCRWDQIDRCICRKMQ